MLFGAYLLLNNNIIKNINIKNNGGSPSDCKLEVNIIIGR